MPSAIDSKIRQRAEQLLKQGMGAQAVADKLGLPRTTVATWRHRAQAPAATSLPRPVAEHDRPAEVPTSARPASTEPLALTVRNGEDLQRLRVVPRIKSIAEAAGFSEAAVTRSLLLIGLASVERDPSLLVSAAKMARESQQAA